MAFKIKYQVKDLAKNIRDAINVLHSIGYEFDGKEEKADRYDCHDIKDVKGITRAASYVYIQGNICAVGIEVVRFDSMTTKFPFYDLNWYNEEEFKSFIIRHYLK